MVIRSPVSICWVVSGQKLGEDVRNICGKFHCHLESETLSQGQSDSPTLFQWHPGWGNIDFMDGRLGHSRIQNTFLFIDLLRGEKEYLIHHLRENLLVSDHFIKKILIIVFRMPNFFSDETEVGTQVVLSLLCHSLIKCLLSSISCRRDLIASLPSLGNTKLM